MENKQTIPRVILIIGANRGIGYYMVKIGIDYGYSSSNFATAFKSLISVFR